LKKSIGETAESYLLLIFEFADADKVGMEKLKLGRGGMVHALRDQWNSLYCAKEFRISQFSMYLLMSVEKFVFVSVFNGDKKKERRT
jgi:hypothetical protein